MGKYNLELEKLFRDWILESEKNNEQRENYGDENIIFTRDGILEKADENIDVEVEWEKSEKRIMFILKDQPAQWCDDVRLWLKRKDNQELKSRFINNLANIFGGLYNGNKNCLCTFDELTSNPNDVKKCFNTYPFVFMESKKQGGNHYIPNNMLKDYLNRYKHFIIREIEIFKPNMIVCMSQIIYGFICGLYPENELIKIEGHNSISIHQESGTLIFCSYHPSARKGYAEIYAGVMNHYRAFLLSEYAGENGLIK